MRKLADFQSIWSVPYWSVFDQNQDRFAIFLLWIGSSCPRVAPAQQIVSNSSKIVINFKLVMHLMTCSFQFSAGMVVLIRRLASMINLHLEKWYPSREYSDSPGDHGSATKRNWGVFQSSVFQIRHSVPWILTQWMRPEPRPRLSWVNKHFKGKILCSRYFHRKLPSADEK